MAQLKCDYPCRLDLFAKVIVAKNIQRDEQIVYDLDASGKKIPKAFCITPPEECGGPTNPILCVEDIKVRNLTTSEKFICNTKVEVTITGDLVMILRTDNNGQDCLFIDVEEFTFTKTIKLSEFTPPLTAQEFIDEVDQSEVVVKNIRFDFDVDGPCYDSYGVQVGTIVKISVFADIIDKLGKFQDVVVFGELDPEDC